MRTFQILAAVVTLSCGSLVSQSHAQEYRSAGDAPSCTGRGCSHGHDTIELIPYDSGASYTDNRRSLYPVYGNSFRTSGPSGTENHPRGRCAGGGCSCAPQQFQDRGSQYENSRAARFRNLPQPPRQYQSNHYGTDQGSIYSSAPLGRSEAVEYSPADQTPQLQALQPYSTERNIPAEATPGEMKSWGNSYSATLSPNEPPPQPTAPQYPPQSLHDHAGHDHAGHNH